MTLGQASPITEIPDAESPDVDDFKDVTLGPDAIADASVPTDAPDFRDAARQPFGAPLLVAELATSETNENPTLTSDLLEIFWISQRPGGPGHGDVWHATRTSPTSKFTSAEVVTEVSLDSKEKSAAVSGDGLTLWFASDPPERKRLL